MPDGTIPDDVIGKSDALHVCAVRNDEREADFIASTDVVDRHQEVVDQDTWLLDTFKKNPVILYGHQSYELPIGQATRCEIVKGKLECTIKFATEDANPKAEQVWQLVRQKVLRAVSVGFRPKNGRYELRDDKEVFVFYDCELREISVVAIPANPEALAKMKAKALEAKADGTSSLNQPSVAKAPDPTKPTATDGKTEFRMDPKEMQAKIDALLLEKAQLQAALVTANVAAEKSATLDAKVKALETERDTMKAATEKLTEELTKTSTARDTATKRADDAETKLIDFEVTALIGKKISAAEKADFVAMRTKMPETFASIVEKREDMKLTERVTTDTNADKSAPNGVANGTAATPDAAGGDLFRSL